MLLEREGERGKEGEREVVIVCLLVSYITGLPLRISSWSKPRVIINSPVQLQNIS